MNSFPAKSLLSCAIVLALLQGCGGGGGGGGSESSSSPSSSPSAGAPSESALVPTAPAPSINFAVKQLQFSWPAVDGATFYRVLEDATGSGTFSQIGGDITALTFNHDVSVHNFNWANARYRVQACNGSGCTSSTTLNATAGVLQTIGYFKASNTEGGDTFGWTIALSDDGKTLAVGAPSENSGSIGVNGSQASNSTANSGAVYVFAKSGNGWIQQAYVKASNTYVGDNFGGSVALSSDGSTLAVGAPFEDSPATTVNGDQTTRTATDAGAVYIFKRNGATWAQEAYVKPTNTYTASYFGWVVALSDDGNTLATGAPGESNSNSGVNPAANNGAANAGAAYVFKRSGSSWSQQSYLKASNAAADDNFGTAIALNGAGTTLAVGAPYEASNATGVGGSQSNNAAATSGAAYVFTYSSNAWAQQAYVKATNTGAGDNFGAQLALDNAGNTLAVGSPYEASSATTVGGSQTDNTAASAGAAYVFSRSGSTWSPQAYIKASNTQTNDNFASSLSFSSDGNTLAVGAIGESSNATGINGDQANNSKDGVGAVYLFKRGTNTTWVQQTYIKPSTSTLGNEFGTAIGLSADGSTLAVSGAFEQSNATGIGGTQTNTSAADAGAVWLF